MSSRRPTRGGAQRASGFGARRGGVDAVRSSTAAPTALRPARPGHDRRAAAGRQRRGRQRPHAGSAAPDPAQGGPVRGQAEADKHRPRPRSRRSRPAGQAGEAARPGQAEGQTEPRSTPKPAKAETARAGPGQGRPSRRSRPSRAVGQGARRSRRARPRRSQPPVRRAAEAPRRARPRSSSRSHRRSLAYGSPPCRRSDPCATRTPSPSTTSPWRLHRARARACTHPPSPPPPPDAPLRAHPATCSRPIRAARGWPRTTGGSSARRSRIEREGVWGLSLLVVRPTRQSAGIGRALLARALEYAGGGRARRDHPRLARPARAARLRARSGSSCTRASTRHGRAARRDEPPRRRPRRRRARPRRSPRRVDRAVRGAAHGGDIEALLRAGRRLLVVPERGYAVARRRRAAACSPRSTRRRPRDLLRAGARRGAGRRGRSRRVDHRARSSGRCGVCSRRGSSCSAGGAVFLRGDVGPFTPYLPSGAYL